MAGPVDVFVTSLPKIAAAIKQSEYARGGYITTNLGQLAGQLEYKDEVFISGILGSACFQLYQATSQYNIPSDVVDKINTEVAGYVTDLVDAYTKQEPVYEMLRDILYAVTRVILTVPQTYPPRRSSEGAASE